MAVRSVIGNLRVNLGIDTAQFQAGLKNAERQLARVGKQMQSIGRSLSASITAPLALAGGATVDAAADFEQGMADMAAILRPTQEEFKRLRDLAIELAQTTKFTAREASDGMEMLARNGIDAANILGGAAKATLNLASATNASLPSAADAMTDVMINFRKSGVELDDIVNNIAGTLVNSKMGWEDYVGALGQAAGAAGPLGMSFADMNAMLAATAPSFKSGVEAGTSFKGFLLRLAPSGKQAKEIMAALNLEFFTAQGFMKSAAEIAEELRTKVGHLTKEAQAETMGALFGQRTVRTALRLIEEGADGIERIKAKIADGNAEEMATRRLDTWRGSWNLARAAVESATIAIGDSGILEWTRGIVDAAAELARSVATLNPEILRWATIMAGIAAAAGPAILAAGLFAAAIGAIGAPVALTIAAVAVVTGTIVAFWTKLQVAARMVSNVVSSVYATVKEWLVDKFGWIADGIQAIIDRVVRAFRWLSDKLGLTAFAASLEKEVRATVDRVGNDFKWMGEAGGKAADYVAEKWREASRQIDDERQAFEGWTKALGHWAAMQGHVIEEDARRALGAWSKMASEMHSNSLLATLRRPSDEIDLGTYGTGTFDASQYDDAERIIKAMQRDAQREAEDMAREGRRVFEQTRTPAEALRTEFERLNKLVRAGAIDFDTYTRAVTQAQNEFSGLADAAENVSHSFGSALEDMLIDGRNWRDSLAGFLKDIAREILRVAALTPLMNALKGGITSAFGGGDGILGSFGGFFAGGGTLGAGKWGIAGEFGPEIIKGPAQVIPNHMIGEGGGGQLVVNFAPQIDNRGASVEAVTRNQQQIEALKRDLPGIVTQAVRKANNSNVKLW